MFRVFNQYVSIKSTLLLILESLLIVLSLLAAAKIRFWNNSEEFLHYTRGANFLFQALTVWVVLQVCLYYNDLYNLNVVRVRSEQFIRLVQAIGAACILLGLIYYMVPGLIVARGVLFISVGLIAITITITRLGMDQVWHLTTNQTSILILGDGEMAMSVAREIEKRGDLHLRLAGFISTQVRSESEIFGRKILGHTDDLYAVAGRENVSRIVVALQDQRGTLPVRELVRLRVQGVIVEDAHTALASLTGKVWLPAVRPSWFVFSGGFHRSRLTLLMKRILDLAFSILGLVVVIPIMAIVAIVIRLDSAGPALFRQERVGLGGKPFELVKFRSMRQDAEARTGAQWAVEDDPRITRIGKILRKYRIDELPQFINVIRGDMSFVGPRPERPVFVDQLREQIPFYDERHSVRPGVTGWAQVEYQYTASIDDAHRKLEYDLFYLKNMSITFDLAIILKTVRIVTLGSGSR